MKIDSELWKFWFLKALTQKSFKILKNHYVQTLGCKNLLNFFCHPLKSHNFHETNLNVSNKSSYQKSCTKVYGLIQFFVLFCKGQMHLIVFRKWLPRCCCISSSFGWCRGVYFLKRKTARQISVYNNEVSRSTFDFFCLLSSIHPWY